MTITLAFLAVVAAILLAGTIFRQWDLAHHLRFTDETGTGRSTLSLARFESRQVLTHPTWLITLGVVLALTAALILGEPGGSVAAELPVDWFAVIALPLAGLALVVSLHRIGTRARRHRTDELEAATPTAPRARTMALLLSCLAPVPVLVLAIAVGVVASQVAADGLMATPVPSNMFPLVGFVLAGVGGAVVGVFLSRWLPIAVAPLLGIVAILWLNNGVEPLDPRFRWLRVAVETNYGGRFDISPYGWAAVFVAGLIVLGGCLALWRHPARPALIAVTAAAVLVIAASGWTMTRSPSPAQVAQRVGELENPRAHQHCETRARREYCVYPGAADWIDLWDPAVRAVLAQVPASARPTRIAAVQRPVASTAPYLTEIVATLDPLRAWAADGTLHPSPEIEDLRAPDLPIAWQTAALAVGLPPATDWRRPSGCLAGGQARLVLAHLLAARATDTTGAGLALKAGWVREDELVNVPVSLDLNFDYDEAKSPPGSAERRPEEMSSADGITTREYIAVAGASGWGSDVLAAEALAAADRADVDRVIAGNWDELVDPATPTSRFLELAGVDAGTEVSGATGGLTATSETAACP